MDHLQTFSAHHLAIAAAVTHWACVAFAVVTVGVHAQRWRVGRAAPTDWLWALLHLPGRYLVDVHGVVAGHRRTAWMHALLAGGFLGSLGLWLAWPWMEGAPWVALQALALAAMLSGVALLGMRRAQAGVVRPERPQRLSRGRFIGLAWALALHAVGSLLLTVAVAGVFGDGTEPAGLLGLACLVPATVYLVGCVRWQPLRHAVFGALYIATHPKPGRFQPNVARQPSQNAGAAGTGLAVAAREDFSWKQLLSFDACIECGRCEAVCPAHATGHMLNPKALIQDLVRTTQLRQEPYTGTAHTAEKEGRAEPLVLGIASETLWSCTTCAACVQACPMFIEHVDVVTDLRRHLTQELGAVPGKLPAMIREVRESGNTHGDPGTYRWSWATDLRLRTLQDVGHADVLLWAGDAGFEAHGQQTLRALVELLQHAGVDFAVLGDEEQDCGHLSRRCGDEAGFALQQERVLRTLSRYRFRVLLTADPHALYTLREEYPAHPWAVAHHTEYLETLQADGRLALSPSVNRTVVYHDPCYLGRYSQTFDAPRAVLQRSGFQMLEAPRARERSFCCGAGGGQAWAGQPSLQSIPVVRAEELAATGASAVAVACPNCKLMLQGALGDRLVVRDVAELMREAL